MTFRSFLVVDHARLLAPELPELIHVLVVDPDPSVAQAIGALAVEALPAHAETLIAKSTSFEGAKRLLDRVPPDERALVILVCASELPLGRSGLEVLSHARAKRPDTRVVLVTNGERNAFVHAVNTRVDGIVTAPEDLGALRSILQFLGGHARRAPYAPRPDPKPAEVQAAVVAMAAALDAVERASDTMGAGPDAHSQAARTALRDAQRLAIAAHRRMLEAEHFAAQRS